MKKKIIAYTEEKEAKESHISIQQQKWSREWGQVWENSVTGTKSDNHTVGWKGFKQFW